MEVEVEGVEADELGEEHIIRLLLTLQVVSEDEATFFAGVPVEVDVELEVACFMSRHNCFFNHINSRLKLRTRIQVKSIQIMVMSVQPIVSSSHTVRINKRYNFNDIVFQNKTSLLGFVKDEIHNTIEYM